MLKHIYVNDSGSVKVYQLDFKIKNCPALTKTIKERNLMKTKFNDNWVIDEDCSEEIDKIAISDANTHIERLVFPAFWIKNVETLERKVCWVLEQIDGKLTFIIHGGDYGSVYSPEVYIKHLRSVQ